MAKLKIIAAQISDIFFDLGSILDENGQKLAQNGCQYQGFANDLRGFSSLAPLANQINRYLEEGSAQNDRLQKIDGFLASLAEEADPARDLLWLLNCSAAGFAFLKERLGSQPALAQRDIQLVMLVQPQEEVFLQWTRLAWKRKSLAPKVERMYEAGAYSLYAQTHASLSQTFGAENVVPAPLWLDRAANCRLALGALGLNPEECLPSLPARPRSAPGLDMARAMSNFLALDARSNYNSSSLGALIARVEKTAGFAKFRGLPAGAAETFARAFGPENAALARRLGLAALFEPREKLPVLASKLPVFSGAECGRFVAALPIGLKTGLLRYFRNAGARRPEERILAAELESWRQGAGLTAIGSWPRPQAQLSVLTLAYQHKDYIPDCMESVAVQRTDFTIEHIIVDDGSTDGTADLIDNYAASHNHVRPIYRRRSAGGAGANVRQLFQACNSPFAALCDGDDYFTDPCKLQKQVDFLKARPAFSLCFHPVDVTYENGAKPRVYPTPDVLPGGEKPFYTLKDLLRVNFMQPSSVVYRWRFARRLPRWFQPWLVPGDWYWHFLHAENGALGYLPERMAVYRRHGQAAYALAEISHTLNRAKNGMRELEFYDAMNRHFRLRFQDDFYRLAAGVYADFTKIFLDTDDSSLLTTACERFPLFGRRFLAATAR